MFSSVDVIRPHKIPIAIGVWISLPVLPPPSERDECQAGGHRRHEDWHEPLLCATLNRLAKVDGASSLWIDYVFAQVKAGIVSAPVETRR